MRRRSGTRTHQRKHRRRSALAIAAACQPCAAEFLAGAEEYEPGHYSGIIHAGHAYEFERYHGWVLHVGLYPGQEDRIDIVCPHFHEEMWSDGEPAA
ncbi:MAG: hypothetical protein J2P30_00760 [Actinobacteria bacterium]|nr:hypothetical protein [Actinomycetota bacterium]